ncbi:MAG: sensor histidine kinase [Anaerovoracaceae bacterium]|jgi:two-component system sensor histidine kinase CiaH
MLRKLQQKVILINMVLVGCVLLSVMGAVVLTSYSEEKHELQRALHLAINDVTGSEVLQGRAGDDSGGGIGRGTPGRRPASRVPTYTVVYLDNGSSTASRFNMSQGSSSFDSSTIDRALRLVKSSNAMGGTLSQYDLCFRKYYVSNGVVIAFASTTQMETQMVHLVTRCIVLFLLAMALLFVISWMLARMAIAPVRRAWGQQQQFVADASHELKTPLTVILANNDILLSHPEETVANQTQWVESTDEEARHMKSLVDNLLYLARSDANQAKLVFSDVPFGELTMDLALQFEPVAFEQGVEIDYSEIDTEIHLQGDVTRLRQLVHILVDNACKYGRDGKIVKISLQRSGSGCALSVHNGGAPIAKEDLPHIFERFYRSDKSRTKREQESGYGLGLAIAKTIVEEHNGRIGVSSSSEEGTTFTAEFRCGRAPKKKQ